MELLVMLGALALLGVLALKFGIDTRDRMQSKEEELAWIGMQWPARAKPPIVKRSKLARVQRMARHLAARALLAVAFRLGPELKS